MDGGGRIKEVQAVRDDPQTDRQTDRLTDGGESRGLKAAFEWQHMLFVHSPAAHALTCEVSPCEVSVFAFVPGDDVTWKGPETHPK